MAARFDVDDFPDDDRVVVRAPSGRAAVLPASARRLQGEALDAYAALMSHGIRVAQLEAEIVELVDQSRELGVSWSLIGAAVGLTSEGARQRYSGDREAT